MTELDFESAPLPQQPRVATVLGLLTVAAAVLSYLGAYAMTNALVAAEVLKAWPRDHDPRPRWFILGFVALMSLFLGVGAALRYGSVRHLRQIEQMDRAADDV